jgi:hypothetical protein
MFDESGFKESEHPRGQPGNAGQFGSKGGGASKIKATGNGAKEQPDFKGSLARETKEDTTQPVKSVDELYERAKKAEGPFKDLMENLAKKYNSEVQYTPEEYAEPGTTLKSRKSAERKLKSELGDDPKLLRDVIRATVVSDRIEDTRKAAADFIGENGDAILRVKDRYVNEMKGGYRDILINYRTPEGLVAEIQFNSKNMVKAKNGSAHALYEKIRELPPGSGSAKTIEQLEQQMATIYEGAYQADGDGKGWKHSIPAQDAANELNGGYKVIRGYDLSQPEGPKFKAAIIEQPDGITGVISNRTGSWISDPEIHYADLIMPEQALSDWDVEPINNDTLAKEIKGEEDARAVKRRATDRSVDIEYYTSETLGPRRDHTPEGFLICYDVPVARVGEMVYGPGEVPFELGLGRDGRVRVSRTEAEVFAKKSMSSLNGKPVTDDHPPVDVDPENWKFYLRGVVVNPRRGEADHKDFLVADLIIYDEETIRDIEAGKREVSCGYNPDYLQLLDDNDVPIPGRGEQVNILYNHLALVKAGRCGPSCSIGDRKTVDALDGPSAFWSLERAARLRRLANRLR